MEIGHLVSQIWKEEILKNQCLIGKERKIT